MSKVPSIAGLCAIGILAAATPVRADAIQITSGTLTVLSRNVPDFQSFLNLEGPRGLTMTARNIVPTLVPVQDCDPGPGCDPGDLISLNVGSSGSDLGALVTLDGHTFGTGLGSSTQGSAFVEFVGSFVVPPFSADPVSVFAPFTFTGNVIFPTDISSEVVDLFGHGTVRVDLAWVATGCCPGWDLQRAVYEFESSEPVPEPATIVLLGSGLVGCLMRRRRRDAYCDRPS